MAKYNIELKQRNPENTEWDTLYPYTLADNVINEDGNSIAAHFDDKNNPHNVTKEQVGLGDVDNVKQATKEEFDILSAEVVEIINNLSSLTDGLVSHEENKSNPHEVTKEQVGLSNVDNVKQASKSDFDAHVTRFNDFIENLGSVEGDVSGVAAAIDKHVKDTDNPHSVTKAQIGLSNVDNVKQASKSEFDSLVQEIETLTEDWDVVSTAINSHAGNKSNPHGVTKAQIGLGNVDNVQQASKTEFNTLSSNFEDLVTDVEDIDSRLGSHAGSTANPHNVTKSQVGLGSVQNYGLATQAEAQTGTSNTKYMTPLRTKEAIDALVGESTGAIDTHVNNKSNPHGVTKAQVGLGNVDNVQQASKTEFNTLSNKVTGMETDLSGVNSRTSTLSTNLTSHTSDTANPHSVTKAQVGLGNVQNYGLATQAEAQAGTSSAKYMTPVRTKDAITALQAVKSVAGKTGAVTLAKGDVGLSNVDNVKQASKSEFDTLNTTVTTINKELEGLGTTTIGYNSAGDVTSIDTGTSKYTIAYSGGNVSTITEVKGSKTYRTTVNYGSDGNVSGVVKQLV